jgi:glycosyltransferase involved in cell wall biosynthesis
MPSLGGSVFVRNAIKYDYCILESIQSIVPLCEELVVLDCQSDDGTTQLLRDFCANTPIRLIENVTWECADNYERLKILANRAISELSTDWHFMIQADEVLHESSIEPIRKAITEARQENTFMVRRINLWGDMDHHIRYDLPTPRKPVSDQVIRIGRRGTLSTGDAESLQCTLCNTNYVNQITLFHYGFVRKNECDKVIDMQSWFHGKGAQPDERVVAMKRKDGVFRPEVFFNKDELAPLMMSHPSVAKIWVEERRSLWI